MAQFSSLFQQSIDKPEEFWAEAAEGIDWIKKWDKVLDSAKPPFYRWFAGATMNTCYNAVDRHVEAGRGEQIAIIYDSPVTDTVRRISYKELQDDVARFAGGLKNQGVSKGDTVIIYMPMIPEAAIAMLACARIGAVHSVVFGGFAASELAIRIDHARPKILISASGAVEGKKIIAYKPLVDKALEQSEHQVEKCIIFQREVVKADMQEGRDLD